MQKHIKLTIGGCIALFVLIIAGLYLGPHYLVYKQTMRGTADFKEAEINRQILVEEARAQEEALQLRANGEAEREKIRARASAESINIMIKALEGAGGETYLRWLWVTSLNDGNSERIYIPTEANLPILEIGK